MTGFRRVTLGLASVGLLIASAGCMDQAIARAGEDRTVSAGETVTLDASASKPEARSRRQIEWEVAEGPDLDFADPSATVVTFTAPSAPTETVYRIRLTVTYVDLGGQPVPSNRDRDDVIVRVRAERNAEAADETADDTTGDNGTTDSTEGGSEDEPGDEAQGSAQESEDTPAETKTENATSITG